MATNKPSSPFVWATGAAGTRQDPGATKKALGWVTNESPASTVFNWLQNYFTSFLASINDHGVAPWDSGSAYAVGALAYSDGIIWKRAVAGSGGAEPGTTGAPWSVAFASSLGANIVLNVPSDYATLQEAFNAARYFLPNDKTVTINIEAGHSPSSGIDCANGNFGFIRIASADTEVTVSGSWAATEDFISCSNGIAPELHTLINMADNGRHGLNISRARANVNPNCGVKNAGQAGCLCHQTGIIYAASSNFSGAGTFGVRAVNGSTVTCHTSDLSGAGNVGLASDTGSTVDADGADASSAAVVGVQASGGTVSFRDGTASGGSEDIAVIRGGIIKALGATGVLNVTANTVSAQGIIMA